MENVLKPENQREDSQSSLHNSSSDAVIAPDSVVLCQKCSKRIVHAAYKYEGHSFHAVCLKCKFCAKNLIGKPLLIEGNKLFCSDHCKKNFEGAAAVTTEPIPNQQDPEPLPGKKKAEETSEGESLIEVLHDIEEGKIDPPKLSKRGSPVIIINNFEDDPDRLTDYPRIQSPEGENFSRRSSLSMSAVSESSLTSEGSSVLSYDANRVPKKKILKNPHHRQRKNSRNHVRWNLPIGDESDTSSVYSFESASTAASEVFGRAKSGVAEVRHGWKGEFEFSPPRGSTGMTPGKHFGHRKIHHSGNHQHHQLYHQQNLRQSQRMRPMYSDSSLGNITINHSPASTSKVLLGGAPLPSPNHAHSLSATDLPHVNINGHYQPSSTSLSPHIHLRGMSADRSAAHQMSTSPLTFTPPDQTHLNYAHSSTPLSHSHSEGAIAVKMKALNATNNSSSSTITVPILRLDATNVRELEESTLEDRQRRHLFQFPQNSPVSQGTSAGQNLLTSVLANPVKNSCSHPPATSKKFLDDDDADDYDHLSPMKNGGETELSEAMKTNIKPKLADQGNPYIKHSKKATKEQKMVTNDDNRALSVARQQRKIGSTHTEKESEVKVSSNTNKSHSISESVSDDKDVPPPVPKKYSIGMRHQPREDDIMNMTSESMNWKSNPGNLRNMVSGPWEGTTESIEVPENKKNHLLPSDTAQHYKTEGKVTNMESTSSSSQPESSLSGAAIATKEKATEASSKDDHLHSQYPHPVPGKSTEKVSATKGGHKFVTEKAPPPIPPKTTHIRRQDRDAYGNPFTHPATASSSQSINGAGHSQEATTTESNLTEDSTDYFVHEQDIVPPPPEFSGMDFFNSKGSKPSHKSVKQPQDDSLTPSTSNTTLVPEPESNSEKESVSHAAISSSGSPLQSGRHKSKNRKLHHQDAVWERVDLNMKQRMEEASRVPMRQQMQVENPGAAEYTDPARDRRDRKAAADPTSHKTVRETTIPESSSTNQIPSSSVASTSQSIEKGKLNSPHANRSSSTKEGKQSNLSGDLPQLLRRVPSRPAPPPPNRPAPSVSSRPQGKKQNDQVTEEEKRALQMAYPANGKIPMMGPTIHNTDKHIQEMLTDISEESNKSRKPNIVSFGMCVSCSKAIASRRDFCSHEGMQYHIGCFQCSRCTVSLQGRTIFKIKNSLFCRDCNPNNASTSRLAVAHRPPQNKIHGPPTSEYYGPPGGEYYNPPPYHPPSTGGQITSV